MATSTRRATLKRHPSEVHLRELANDIAGEYDKLGTFLGFNKPEMDRLRQDYRNFEDRVFNMLVNWKQRNFKKMDLFKDLCYALEKCYRNDLVEKVEQWREAPHKSRDIVDEEEEESGPGSSPTGKPKLLRSFSQYRTLEEVQLRDLSAKIGSEWEKFATFLGVPAVEVYKIKLSETVAENRVFEVMVQWQRRMSKHTNMVKTLAKALEDSGRMDLKEELLEKAGYSEERRKESVKRDLLEIYQLPPFLGEIMKGYQKIDNPTIPFELFVEICILLNPTDVLGNDWRRLAEKLELSRYISYLESEYKEGPTSGVLWCWMKENKSLEELAQTLDEMDRGDAALKIYTHLGIEPPT